VVGAEFAIIVDYESNDNYLTTEQSRLLSCLLHGSRIKENKIIRAEVVNLHLAMRAFTDSFIVSNPGQNHTVSELHYCTSLREK